MFNSLQLELAGDRESREMRRTIELLRSGGTGNLSETKTNGWIRIMFENWNSLGIGTQSWKIDRLNYLIKHLRIDIIAGCESQCDWSMVHGEHQLSALLVPGTATKVMTAHNTTERIQKNQAGGTAIAGIGRICDNISDTGSDHTGLGRWSWLKLGHGNTSTRIISAYLPHKPGRHSRGRTVWEQHSRYFEARGDLRYPSTIFTEHLLDLISQWISHGEHVLLAIDANQDVYKGRLALRLKEPPFNMTCLLEDATGEQVPNSHFSGGKQISTIFGSSGVVTGQGICFPHWFGIGDHRVMVLEFSAKAAFNGTYPTIAKPKARTLNSKLPRLRRQYCDTLSKLTHRHRMQHKFDSLAQLSPLLTNDQFQYLHTKYDHELGDLMRNAETRCTKRFTALVDFSPTVGQWLKKRAVLKWILRWHDGKVPDPRNLLRTARRHHIDNPLELSRMEIGSRLVACMQEIYSIRQQAPTLRKRHLQWRLTLARDRSDDTASKEIQEIIKREAKRRQQNRINAQIKPLAGRSVVSVTVTTPTGDTTYDSKDQVEHHTAYHLRQRFSLGQRAPLHQNRLHQDFGNVADTAATDQLFAGTYTFPENCDTATIQYLQEAVRIKSALQTLPMDQNPISTKDFIDFWASAKESTSSSKSGRHFGHYKAVTDHPALITLHVTNINLAAMRGTPLNRWCEGVNVLLEKISGNSHIDKLRAICLLEADFNWWLKVIFARRMMSHIMDTGILPPEQGATKGKTPLDTSLLKQLFYDQANILHEDCSSSSTDAEFCYDAVNHAACSIAMQAMGVPISMVRCYLTSVQNMQYFLQTGFGLSDRSYGGTADSICMGLTQGSGASPGAWSATSTVIVGAYKRQGYGATLHSGWSGNEVHLAALLYVDDTDLLHSPPLPVGPLKDLVQWTQNATNCWANLLRATGGNLKPAKCYWYLMSYKFVNGIPKLRSKSELAQHTICIPQPDNSHIPIELLDPSYPSKVLGIWSTPAGDSSKMMEHMVEKGMKWATRVQSSTLHPREVWYSFSTQALPAVRYGLISLMASRQSIDNHLPKWYFKCLPHLGINRSITLPWRTLPRRFQGLGLPIFSLEKLADCLRLLQRHWGTESTLGKALKCSFELVQVETGLEGNFLTRSYPRLSNLASHSWLKLLWELIHHYQVTVVFPEGVSIPPLRERDKVLMEEIIKILPPSQWVSFNRVRKFHKVYFISQLTLCDGKTIHPALLTPTNTTQSTMRFPREFPTAADFTLWVGTLRHITSASFTLATPLGHFLRLPYTPTYWKTNSSCSQLVLTSQHSDDVYLPSHTTTKTRRSKLYEKSTTTERLPDTTLLASALPHSTELYHLHSSAELLHKHPTCQKSLLQALKTHQTAHLFRHITIDDDGDWIIHAARNKTLIIVHDGSYMPHLDGSICSAAVVILCTATMKMGTVHLCEKTNHHTASNYRGEILGGIITSQILLSIDSLNTSTDGAVTCYCDNLGVIHHANNHSTSLPESQKQTDALLSFRRQLQSVKLKWAYKHVHSHQDANYSINDLTIPEQLNVLADAIAKQALKTAHQQRKYSKPNYPGEPIQLFIDGHKITSSIKAALYTSWGTRTAQTFLHKQKIVRERHFHLVDWDNVEKAMSTLPKMLQVWITKHVSGFCGTNKHLSRVDKSHNSRCNCCGAQEESTQHITRCTNPGRTKMFHETVSDLVHWMRQKNGHPLLAQALQSYLTNRGRIRMSKICSHWPSFSSFSRDHDNLGWDSFIMGRISKSLLAIQQSHLTQVGSRQSISSWASQFTHKLLNIPHKQWLYRNARIHIRLVEGLTTAEHDTIRDQVVTLLSTDPDDLLPQHQPLLTNQDFEHLGRGTTLDRQHWVAQMTSAVAAANHILPKRSREAPMIGISNKRPRT